MSTTQQRVPQNQVPAMTPTGPTHYRVMAEKRVVGGWGDQDNDLGYRYLEATGNCALKPVTLNG